MKEEMGAKRESATELLHQSTTTSLPSFNNLHYISSFIQQSALHLFLQ
jgi:hypothetical protein